MNTSEAFIRMAPGARKSIIHALSRAADWEWTVMESYREMTDDPEYKRADRDRAKFKRLHARFVKAHRAGLGLPS